MGIYLPRRGGIGDNLSFGIGGDGSQGGIGYGGPGGGGGGGAFSDLVIAAGPDAYYQQNELSGTVATDSMGLIDGTYEGVVLPVLGSTPLKVSDPKTSVLYTGTQGTCKVVPGVGSPLHTSGDIAIETMYYLPVGLGASYKGLVHKGSFAATYYAINAWVQSGTGDHYLYIENGVGGGSFFVATPPNSQVRHLAVNWSAAGAVTVYLDGSLIGSGTSVRSVNTENINIGYNLRQISVLKGNASDTAFYSRLLTPAEILQRATKALIG